MKKKKILIPLIVVILGAGGFAYKSTKKIPVVHLKIAGITYVLPTPFLLNLSDGQYAKITVGLELAPGQTDGVTAATAGQSTPSDGIGTLPEEPEIRAIVTNVITNSTSGELINAPTRTRIEQQILTEILQQTDDKVDKVIFTDLAVQ
jgi:flagellar FliL protein